MSDIARQRPGSWLRTLGNVATSPHARKHQEETAVAGWAERIRTALCPIRTGLSKAAQRVGIVAKTARALIREEPFSRIIP
jgi:hypothetical protein